MILKLPEGVFGSLSTLNSSLSLLYSSLLEILPTNPDRANVFTYLFSKAFDVGFLNLVPLLGVSALNAGTSMIQRFFISINYISNINFQFL